MSKGDIDVIPRTRRVIYTTYAAFPTTGLDAGDLAYATDLRILYRWNGTAWENISPEWNTQSFVNLFRNGDFEIDDPPAHWILLGAAATFARSAVQARINTYSGLLTRNGTDCHIYQAVADFTRYRSRNVTIGAWIYATVANRARLNIYDSVDDHFSDFHSGVAGWEWLTATADIDAAAGSLWALFDVVTGDTAAYIDGAILVEGEFCPAFSPSPAEFQQVSGTYTGDGNNNRNITVGFI